MTDVEIVGDMMLNDMPLLPNFRWVMESQPEAAWIYISLLLCLTIRVWISLRFLCVEPSHRREFLDCTSFASDSAGNISILIGVIGTLLGIAVSVAGQAGSADIMALLESFGKAFSIAITTTVSGGLSYIVCLILGSLEEMWVARK